MSDKPQIEVFFDGACPICSREIAMIRRLDRDGKIDCTDIVARGFDASAQGLDPGAVNRQIHGRLSDGRVVTGVEVFRQIYGLLGFRRWVEWSRRPLIAKLLDYCYAAFARYRRYIALPFRWTHRQRT